MSLGTAADEAAETVLAEKLHRADLEAGPPLLLPARTENLVSGVNCLVCTVTPFCLHFCLHFCTLRSDLVKVHSAEF